MSFANSRPTEIGPGWRSAARPSPGPAGVPPPSHWANHVVALGGAVLMLARLPSRATPQAPDR